MPSIANITVKASNGTTDVVYVAKSASAGDGVPAVFRNDSLGVSMNQRPEFRLSFKDSGKNRVGRVTYTYPDLFNTAVAGVYSIGEIPSVIADFKVPKGATTSTLTEFAHQFGNLMAAVLIKSAVSDGSNLT